MDSINVDKIQALRKYKEQQFVSNLLFYPLATLSFGLFCSSPFWFPSLYDSTKTLVCVSIPQILSLFFSAKSLFVLGNLIVIFLLRESKVRPSNPSYNNNNGDDLVKPILPQTKSKKAEMHTVWEKKSNIQPSEPLYYNNIDSDPERLTLPSNIETDEKVKMLATFSQTTAMVVSEWLSERTVKDPYLIGKTKRVRFVVEEKDRSMTEGEDRVGNEAKEEALCQVKESREDRGEEEEAQVAKEKTENLKNERGKEIIQAALSTEELKRRADDFIAMVNKQLRLEAEDVLLDSC